MQNDISINAALALKAATMRKQIGNHAARRMVERAHCPAYLFRLACQLHASREVAL